MIDGNDVYFVLRSVLEELPPGAANLEREEEWGRSQLSPERKGAAALYGVGSVGDCEIGIVGLTHSHFHAREEAVAFCREVIRGEVSYNVWSDGEHVVRAQRIHADGNVVDMTEALVKKAEQELRKETVKFEPYV